ncbi:MAG: hypothetical protein J6C19_10445 [Lachnospiraceae bacterium]|nr:hypothetical protein [Lachnospiraceae bacterium]MBO5145934.1 hypothetical protein [Lachnospiraceae bacterium]
MNKEEAKELLSFHSCRNSDIHNPKWTDGFLGSLRPFAGKLNQENFIEIMECLNVLKEEFSKPTVDKEIVSDIVGITCLTRAWASPEGMLGRNHLLTNEQTKQLLLWTDIMEECLMCLLEEDWEDAFWDYHEYLEGRLD